MTKRQRTIEAESDGEGNGGANGQATVPPGSSQPVGDESENSDFRDDDAEDDEDEDSGLEPGREHSEAGVIEEVHLENFMCHRAFTIKFGKNINFIVGENGSGKSAILVAISVCLGAKSAQTKRATKLSDLIMNGSNASSALVRVTLRNRGPEAYQHDRFGDKIIVERRISRDGASTFRLKGERNQLVYSSLKELELILEQFNIQVNNPCAIMSQDISREFLTNTTPTKLYEFFLKATQLDDIQRSFQSTHHNLQQMKIQIVKNQKQLPDMEAEFEKLKAEVDELKVLEDMGREKARLMAELAWAIVHSTEQEARNHAKLVQRLEKDIEKLEAKLATIEASKTSSHDIVQAKEREASAIEADIYRLRDEQEGIVQEAQSVTKQNKADKVALNESRKRLENFMQRRKRIDDLIAEARAKAARANDEDKRDRLAGIQQLQETLAEKTVAKEASEKKKTELDRDSRQLSDRISQLERQEAQIKHEVDRLSKDLKSLEARKTDRLSIYGPAMSRLVSAVEQNASKFKVKPIGPVGAYINVPDERWFIAVEACLTNRVMSGFVLDNHEDRVLLLRLARQVGQNEVPCFVQKLEHRFQVPQPQHRFPTVLGAMTIENDQAFNAVVNNASPEDKILIESGDEARDVIFQRRGRPRDVNEAYIMDGTRLSQKGKGTNNYVPYNNPKQFFRKDTTAQADDCKRRLAEAQERVRQLAPEKQQLQGQLAALRKDISGVERIISQTAAHIRRTEREIQEQQELLNQQQEAPTELADQVVAAKKLDTEIEAATADVAKREKTVAESTEKLRPFEERKKEMERRIESVTLKHDKLMDAVREAGTELADITTKESQTKTALDKRRGELAKATAERNAATARAEAERAKVTGRYDEVHSDLSADDLASRLSSLNARIEAENNARTKSAQQVRREYEEATRKYQAVQSEIGAALQHCAKLEGALNSRDQKLKALRRSIAKRSAYLFNAYLHQRSFAGKLIFDHKATELAIEISTETATASGTGQETRALSGGERSFSTVSLLLALWEAMETPFRAMDEFDVFMDAVNRRVSIDMIISCARVYTGRQFIFITPQGYQAITHYADKGKGDIVVHRMHPPDRSQQTLNFPAQANGPSQ